MSTMTPSAQRLGLCHCKVGDLVVTAICDGLLDASLDLVTGIGRDEAERALWAARRGGPPRLTINAFVVWGEGAPILVDAGAGPFMGPTGGRLMEGLDLLGLAPDTIGSILLTHAHIDHVGALAENGAAMFPNAELVLSALEAGHWLDEGLLARTPEANQASVRVSQAALGAYRGRLRTFEAGEVLPGVTAVPEPGHTPGHTGFRIDSDGRSLLIWGDIVHVPGLQFARPEAGVVFDLDGPAAVATRRRIFDMTASEDMMVAGMHLDFPTFGRVVREGAGYRFLPDSFVSLMP